MAGKRSSKKRKSAERNDKEFLLGLIILFILVAIAVVFFNKPTAKNDIAATVNGENIYYADLNAQYDRISPDLKQTYSKDDLLIQMIDRTLLLQQAKRSSIEASEERVNETLNQIASQLPENTSLEEALSQEGVTMEELRNEIKDQVTISMFLEKYIVNDINVTQQEINDYAKQTFGDVQINNETEMQVSQFLLLQKQRKVYDAYMNTSREVSDIKIYKEGEMYDDGVAVEPIDSNESTSTTPVAEESSTSMTEEVSGSEQNISTEQEHMAGCLNSKSAVLYGTDSCDFTIKQATYLGEWAGQIKFVECEDANGAMIQECKDAGIEVYPTWSIDGKLYKGTYTLKQLKQISGC